MRPFWKKTAAVGFLVFLGLWIAGTCRSWAQPYPQPVAWHLAASEEPPARLQVANNLTQLGLALKPLPLMLDQPEVERIQVYEKSALLGVGTATFDDDEALIRSALAGRQASIFNEKKSGLAPQRRLTLAVGVTPDKFDALVEQLRQIAHLESFSVQQRDRTGEFRRLHAQRQSLKKYLEAVQKLRSAKAPLSVEDALKLEQKVQDIEKELHVLSVQFGEWLGKESYYHVYVTLVEYQPGGRLDPTYTVPRRLAHGALWALAWWGVGAAAVGMLAAAGLSVKTLWPTRALAGAAPAPAAPAT
jgi:hypothetical protein